MFISIINAFVTYLTVKYFAAIFHTSTTLIAVYIALIFVKKTTLLTIVRAEDHVTVDTLVLRYLDSLTTIALDISHIPLFKLVRYLWFVSA